MKEKLEQRSFMLFLVLVTLFFLFLLKPFFGVMFWACAIAVLFYPLQRRLQQRWPRRTNLTALSTLSICMLIGIIPTLFLIMSFLQEGIGLYQRLQDSELDLGVYFERVKQAFPVVQTFLDRFNIDQDNIKEQLTNSAIAASRFVAENAVQFGQGTLQFFINLGLMLYVAFFMLRDGHTIITLLIRALPIGDEREYLLFGKFAEVTRATIKGNLVVAIVQGGLGGLIFWMLGIPSALFWGAVMTVLSLIPVVGAGLIWLPVAIYLFATGEWLHGLILALFGAFVIGLVDNVLRPILVGRDTKLPDYVVLLSTLGGLVMFGINGFVIGPLIAALFFAFWQIFMREFNPAEITEEGTMPELNSEIQVTRDDKSTD